VDDKLLRTLQSADDSEHSEHPPDFDWHTSRDRIHALRPVLERIAGRSLVIDDQVQDATYFAALSITEPVDGRPNHRHETFALYFSSFGSLVGIWNEGVLSQATLDEMIRAMENHGLVVVDAAQLQDPYTGRQKGFAGRRWIDRFFNYT
jgi:hypothetical protein